MIHLSIGRMEIDWGKNNGFSDHSALFQEADICDVPYYYVDTSKEDDSPIDYNIVSVLKVGLSKPLSQVIDRIQLLGHTLSYCELEFQYLSTLNSFDTDRFDFAQLRKVLEAVNVETVSADYGEGGEDFGKFFRREIFPRLDFSSVTEDPYYVEFEVSYAMENLSPYTVIQLLGENPSAADLPVQWAFSDIEEAGWAKRSEFVKILDSSNRFLIVTEGSSDALIIKHALKVLKPHIQDFFDFVDMEEGYPFSGVGNLVNFVKGLISISVQNNIVILFDNDAEGVASYNKCQKFNLPANMVVLKLPDLDEFDDFKTIGPNGEHYASINGKGAAIECYLDLGDAPIVRWNNYNPHTDSYQGELVRKDSYKKDFLGRKNRDVDYNYAKIERVLDLIIQNCIAMKEKALINWG